MSTKLASLSIGLPEHFGSDLDQDPFEITFVPGLEFVVGDAQLPFHAVHRARAPNQICAKLRACLAHSNDNLWDSWRESTLGSSISIM